VGTADVSENATIPDSNGRKDMAAGQGLVVCEVCRSVARLCGMKCLEEAEYCVRWNERA
jgi:hypothetical protein